MIRKLGDAELNSAPCFTAETTENAEKEFLKIPLGELGAWPGARPGFSAVK
jgi:hypothetical protein